MQRIQLSLQEKFKEFGYKQVSDTKISYLDIYIDSHGIIRFTDSKSKYSKARYGRDCYGPKSYYNFIGNRNKDRVGYYFTIGYNPDMSIAYHYEDIIEKLLMYERDDKGRIISCEEININGVNIERKILTKYEYNNYCIKVITEDKESDIPCDNYYNTFTNNYFSPYSGINIKTKFPIGIRSDGKIYKIIRDKPNENQFYYDSRNLEEIKINIRYIDHYNEFKVYVNGICCYFKSNTDHTFNISIRKGKKLFTIDYLSKILFGVDDSSKVDPVKFMSKIIDFSDIIYCVFNYYDIKTSYYKDKHYFNNYSHKEEGINYEFCINNEFLTKWFNKASLRIENESRKIFGNDTRESFNINNSDNEKTKNNFHANKRRFIEDNNILYSIDWSKFNLKPIDNNSSIEYIDGILKTLYNKRNIDIQAQYKLVIALYNNYKWSSDYVRDYHLQDKPYYGKYATALLKEDIESRVIKKFLKRKSFRKHLLTLDENTAYNYIYKSIEYISYDKAKTIYSSFIESLTDKEKEIFNHFKALRDLKDKINKNKSLIKVDFDRTDKSDFTSIIDDEELFGNDPDWNLDLNVEDDDSDIYIRDIYYSSSKEYYFNTKEYINQLNEKIMRGRV